MSTSVELVERAHSHADRVLVSRERAASPAPDHAAAARALDSSAPDGGYGWVVLAGCFVITFWYAGTTYSWGVTQAALVQQGLSSTSTLAFVGSLSVACIAIFALVNARLIRLLGTRYSAILAITLLSVGEFISSFVTRSVAGLFLATGVLMGLGVSLCFMVVSVTPSQYFTRKRGRANGIVYAGAGLGGAAISYAIDALILRLGIPWTLRLLGIMSFVTGMPAAWLVKQRVPISRSAFIDWSLFTDPGFVVLFLVGVVATFPLFVPPFFLPLYSATITPSSSTGAALVAAFNFASAVGRMLCGVGCDMFGPLNTLIAALLLSAISMLVIWPASTSIGPLVAFAIINGAANGGFFSTMPTVVGNTFGSTRVSVVMGMIVTGWAGGYLLGAPIAGFILQASGGEQAGLSAFRKPIYYAGSLTLGAAMLAGFVRLRQNPKILARA